MVASVSLCLPAAFSACSHQAVFSAPTGLHLHPKHRSPDFTLSNRSDLHQLGENKTVLIRDGFQFYAGHFCELFRAYFFKTVQFSTNVTHPSSRPNAIARQAYVLHRTGTEGAQYRYPASASTLTGKGNGFTSHIGLWKPLKNSKETKHVCLAEYFTAI